MKPQARPVRIRSDSFDRSHFIGEQPRPWWSHPSRSTWWHVFLFLVWIAMLVLAIQLASGQRVLP